MCDMTGYTCEELTNMCKLEPFRSVVTIVEVIVVVIIVVIVLRV